MVKFFVHEKKTPAKGVMFLDIFSIFAIGLIFIFMEIARI